MKAVFKALAFAAVLVPVAAMARDYDRYPDRWRPARSRIAENFERQHPRWPRAYCHTHRFPLHRDDSREHCHNWNRDSWQAARERWSGGGWYANDRRDDRSRWDRHDRDRRHRWYERYH